MAVKPLIVPSYRYTLFFKGFAMHAIIIFLNYLSKLLNLTLNFKLCKLELITPSGHMKTS